MRANQAQFSCSSSVFALIAAAFAATATAPAHAGGPIAICQSGQPFVWPSGGANIPFNPDLGPLGPLNNTDAVSFVGEAFGVWQAVPSATATYINAGSLAEDVDINNFAPYLFPAAPDGLSAVIFDSTGEIFELLFGPGSGILGFAGPEWVDFGNCTILEGVAVLNGAEFSDPVAALDVMVHEFGHYSGLGHTVVNGQVLIGDTSGPTPDSTFGFPEVTDVETMYPFYFGPGSGSSTLANDDKAALSALYPEPVFDSSSGTVSGRILRGNGEPVTGVNVIARNLADPFGDAISAISGDHSVPSDPADPLTGAYRLRGLEPGAQYAIFVDQILAGGFSVPVVFPLPGPEEFYNGANESDNYTTTDPVLEFTSVSAGAGSEVPGIEIIFNLPRPGDPLLVGDDGSVELPLPFAFEICGQRFRSVHVNANGHLTFGAPDPVFVPSAAGFLSGPPRIAALWDDLNPNAGGKVTFSQTKNTFKVSWEKVPEFPGVGEANYSIELRRASDEVRVKYGTMTSVDGLAGITGGALVTSRFETPSDLTAEAKGRINLRKQPAVFELFGLARPNDLNRQTLRYSSTTDFNDTWAENNDRIRRATRISLPFDSKAVKRYTEIEPVGDDVDFYSFRLKAGDLLIARVLTGSMDSLLGLFTMNKNKRVLVAVDDDGGPGVLSELVYQVPESGEYALAATSHPDLHFTGAGASGGRYVLDVMTIKPNPNDPIVNGSFEIGFLGWTHLETAEPFIPWLVEPAGSGAGFDMAPTQPPQGDFNAWNGFDGAGPMSYILFQDVTIRANATSVVLHWSDRLQWNYLTGTQTIPRSYSVQVRDPATDAILQVLHSFDTGIAPGLGDSSWQEHTADMSGFVGQAVRIYFEEVIPEPFTGPGQFEIDAISLQVQ